MALALGACGPKRALVSPILYPTAWIQTSAEYEAAARQAFNAAARALDAALADSTWTAALEQTGDFAALPPAIITDVDETMLDNSPFEARMAKAGLVYDDPAFDAWVESAEADPIPGALEFATEAARRGVTIFYVSGRGQALEEATRRNLERRGFPLDPGVDVVPATGEQPEWTSDKTSRRAWVASRYRVLLVIGDDFNDFVNGRVPLEQRAELVRENAERWGRRWIVVPNPIYGSWERALYDFEPDLSDAEKARRVAERLDARE
jgi:5'-nucleotidase (lipoprotein e(P4) family)